MSCKTVVEVVEAVPKDDQGVQADEDDSNHDGSGRQEHFSQVLGLSISRKLERHVCQEVAWETWCCSEEQSTDKGGESWLPLPIPPNLPACLTNFVKLLQIASRALLDFSLKT